MITAEVACELGAWDNMWPCASLRWVRGPERKEVDKKQSLVRAILFGATISNICSTY